MTVFSLGDDSVFDLEEWIERNVPEDAVAKYPNIPPSWYQLITQEVSASFPTMPSHLIKEYVDSSLRMQYYKLLVER